MSPVGGQKPDRPNLVGGTTDSAGTGLVPKGVAELWGNAVAGF